MYSKARNDDAIAILKDTLSRTIALLRHTQPLGMIYNKKTCSTRRFPELKIALNIKPDLINIYSGNVSGL